MFIIYVSVHSRIRGTVDCRSRVRHDIPTPGTIDHRKNVFGRLKEYDLCRRKQKLRARDAVGK